MRDPRARQAAAPVDRLRRAEGRPGGARALRAARRLRRDGPAQRRGDRRSAATRATTRTCSRRACAPSVYKRLQDPDNGAPLANRATQGLYPTGSTFKLITATAALQSGLITPSTVLFDGGSLTVGGVTFKNAGRRVARRARAAARAAGLLRRVLLSRRPDGGPAGRRGDPEVGAAGSGSATRPGIDLPGEGAGLVPTPEWRNRLFRRNLTDRPWTPGDNINLAVGQGDLQADPLQMAVAYSAIANGGRIVTPAHRPARRGQRRPHPAADRAGRRARGSTSPPRRASRSCRACGRPRTTRAARRPPVFDGLPDHGRGQDRHGRARRAGRPVLVRRGGARTTTRASWSRSTIERGGFGAEAAAPGDPPDPGRLLRDQGQEGDRRGGELTGLMASSPRRTPFGTGVQRFSEPRARMLRLDLLVLLATLGLIAFSLVTLDTATADRRPGLAATTSSSARRVYAVVGLALMLVLASIDYSRFRELRVGLYAAMIGLIVLVLGVAGRDPRVAALDRAAVLPLPAVGAGQGAADPGPVGVHHRPRCGACRTAKRPHGSCCWRCCRHCW